MAGSASDIALPEFRQIIGYLEKLTAQGIVDVDEIKAKVVAHDAQLAALAQTKNRIEHELAQCASAGSEASAAASAAAADNAAAFQALQGQHDALEIQLRETKAATTQISAAAKDAENLLKATHAATVAAANEASAAEIADLRADVVRLQTNLSAKAAVEESMTAALVASRAKYDALDHEVKVFNAVLLQQMREYDNILIRLREVARLDKRAPIFNAEPLSVDAATDAATDAAADTGTDDGA